MPDDFVEKKTRGRKPLVPPAEQEARDAELFAARYPGQHQCEARAKRSLSRGKRCKNPVEAGEKFCKYHLKKPKTHGNPEMLKPEWGDKVREMYQSGGIRMITGARSKQLLTEAEIADYETFKSAIRAEHEDLDDSADEALLHQAAFRWAKLNLELGRPKIDWDLVKQHEGRISGLLQQLGIRRDQRIKREDAQTEGIQKIMQDLARAGANVDARLEITAGEGRPRRALVRANGPIIEHKPLQIGAGGE